MVTNTNIDHDRTINYPRCDNAVLLAVSASCLYLNASGTTPLRVEGDRVKVRRIAQNLLLNALKYTKRGGITLTWADTAANDDGRWFFTIDDSGPGFHVGPGAPIVNALSSATSEANASHPSGDTAPLEDPRPVGQPQGEGIGLAIVKRLCDLLNATVELETVIDQGTTVRILVPRHYPPAPAA